MSGDILDFYSDNQSPQEGAEDGDAIIVLSDEDGNEVEMVVLDIVEHKGSTFAVLTPANASLSGEALEITVLRAEYDEKSGEYIYVSGDEAEFDEVFEKFRKQLGIDSELN